MLWGAPRRELTSSGRSKEYFFENMKVVLERLERNEQEEAEEEAVWGRLTTPERRLSNYSFGLPWLLIDYMLRLRVHAADKGCSVGMFSPGFWLGMDVAFSGGGGGVTGM